MSRRQKLLVSEGQHIAAGTPLTEGQLDPKEILRIMGRNVAQKMLVDEVQKVYRDQGVGIHAKHIEVIVRQMLRRVTILEPGDTTFMPGELVDRMAYLTQNRRVAAEGGQPALRPPDADGHYEGVAGHGFVAECRVLPGDHQGPDRGRHERQVGLPGGPQGERHPR